MKTIRYLFEYIFIIILFGLLKLLGYRIASEFGCLVGKTFGPFFRSKKVINLIKNLNKKNFSKATLGGCIFIKKNDHLCLSREKI